MDSAAYSVPDLELVHGASSISGARYTSVISHIIIYIQGTDSEGVRQALFLVPGLVYGARLVDGGMQLVDGGREGCTRGGSGWVLGGCHTGY